jgi:AcrR family transcriptional regulator
LGAERVYHWCVPTPPNKTRERILSAATALLRKHGPAKVTVLDVAARAGMSHPNVYRHFKSKRALQEAVTEIWLKAIFIPLEKIAVSSAPADRRLEKWMMTLSLLLSKTYTDDPELFLMYRLLAKGNTLVIQRYQAALREQLIGILQDGIATKIYRIRRVPSAATALWDAMHGFVNPDRVMKSAGNPRTADVRRLFRLLDAGLKAGVL